MTHFTRRELLQGAVCSLPLGAISASGVAAAASASGTATAAPSAVTGKRERTLLDFDWRFHLGHAADMQKDFGFGQYQRTFAKAGANTALAAQLDFSDADWRPLNLPHDWAVELPFVPSTGADAKAEEDLNAAHGYKPLGRNYPDTSVGWYRRNLDIPAGDLGRRISLEFDGVFRDCVVFCNGYVVSRNESGYTPFRVDVTDFLNYGGRNVIAVRVDATLGEGWFYEGAGIYRHVWLVKTAALHVPQWGVFVRPEIDGNRATLNIETEIANESLEDRRCLLRAAVIAPDGSSVGSLISEPVTLKAGTRTRIVQKSNLNAPALWSLEKPQLYRLDTVLEEQGQPADAVQTSFGVRSIKFDAARGFLLNGVAVKLKGTCNHQDHAGVGAAVPDRLLEWRIERLKELGCNAYRTSHNPPAPELLEICDRLGMVVIDETRIMSTDDEAMSQLTRLVRRDRNHPSVILWSIGNEEPQQATERGARVARAMKQQVNLLDPSRLCTYAMDSGFGEGVSTVVDVLGFNYRTDKMPGFHEKFPHIPILGSETGSTVGTRGIYHRDDTKGYVRAYDLDHPWWASTAESWWTIAADRPYIAGGFVWTGFDYRGEPTPFNRFPSISSHFGIMDTCGFPKDNYYYYQARWREEPVLHLLPHWNWEPGSTIDVWCHTNLDTVELFLNDATLGKRKLRPHSHLEWKVPFAPGVLEARGYRDGKLVLTTRRETAGKPAGIVLRPDRTALRADGRDLTVVAVEIVDAQGRIVPTADNEVAFAVTGPGAVIGVGNGNPISHESDKGDRRRAFSGLCMAIVQSQRSGGEIVVEATSQGLNSARIALTGQPA
ncbi:MAG TPA: beta-galactosidase GalA [Povalibacter sp.]